MHWNYEYDFEVNKKKYSIGEVVQHLINDGEHRGELENLIYKTDFLEDLVIKLLSTLNDKQQEDIVTNLGAWVPFKKAED